MFFRHAIYTSKRWPTRRYARIYMKPGWTAVLPLRVVKLLASRYKR